MDGAGFRHEALFYAGEEDFVERTGAFIADGLAAGEAILVVVTADKIERLRSALGADSEDVLFADMADVGGNPARIIPAWRDFVAEFGGDPSRRLRGIGEPVHPARTADEVLESQLHETLLNLAFDGGRPWWLLCPYDVAALDESVIEEATRSHPHVWRGDDHELSAAFRRMEGGEQLLGQPLPPLQSPHAELPYAGRGLSEVRTFVTQYARAAGLDELRTDDVVLAVNEVVTNTLRHAGGSGVLRVWVRPGALTLEVSDDGSIDEPLIGRVRPAVHEPGGFGLWLVNQLCDLVQIRSLPTGVVVRLHVRQR